MLNNRARSALKWAGWHEGRCVNIEEVLQQCRAEGYEPFPAFIDFAKEFMNLKFRSKDGFITDFNILQTLKKVIRERVASYEEIIGEQLCPIGTSEGCNMLIAKSGAFYWGQEQTLLRVGATFDEAVNRIVENEGEKFELIPWPDNMT